MPLPSWPGNIFGSIDLPPFLDNFFIMSDIFLCCFRILFISDTEVPDPAAILFFLDPLIIFGLLRSYFVIERIIASC